MTPRPIAPRRMTPRWGACVNPAVVYAILTVLAPLYAQMQEMQGEAYRPAPALRERAS